MTICALKLNPRPSHIEPCGTQILIKCLFRILHITECIYAFIFIQCVIPKWQKN